MNLFFREAISVVLTSTLNEIFVLSHGKCLHLSTTASQHSKTNKQNNVALEFGKSNLHSKTLNEIKLNNELKKFIDIYLETLEELQNANSIKKLLRTINQQTSKNNQQEVVIQEYIVNTTSLKELKTRLVEFKSEAENKLLRVRETLNILKSDWRIISKVNELEYELVRKWEHTRFTQAVIVSEKDEFVFQNNIASFIEKNESEKRVIYDFQTYSKRQVSIYSEMIETWKTKYTKDLQDLLLCILKRENKIKEVQKTYEKLSLIYEKRRIFIVEYLEQKAEQNRLHQLQTQRIESAVKIQAWWRGLMVRRCLGPFKKKAKKGKKGKKSK